MLTANRKKEKLSAIQLYLSNTSNVFAENRLLKMVLMALIVVTFVNSYSVFRINDSTRHYLMPLASTGDLWVSSQTASNDYLSAITKYVIYNVANYTPATVDTQLSTLLTAFHPSAYPRYRETFQALSKKAERYASVSSAIQIDTSKAFMVEDNTVTLYATRLRLAGNVVSKKDYVKYSVHYRIENGRYWVMDIEEHVHE